MKTGLSARWIRQTEALFVNSEDPNGGFGGLNIDQPTSWYDTYYNVQLLRFLKQEVPHEKQLENTLTHQSAPKALNQTSLSNLYYVSQLDHLLGVGVPKDYRLAVARLFLSLRQSDGLYALSKRSDLLSALATSRMVYAILRDIHAQPASMTSLTVTLTAISPEKAAVMLSPAYGATVSLAVWEISADVNIPSVHQRLVLDLKGFVRKQTKIVFSSKPQNPYQIINDIALYQLDRLVHYPVRISQSFLNSLSLYESKDGGYGLLSNQTFDPQFTWQLLQFQPSKKPHVQEMIQRIEASQLPNGTFATTTPIPTDVTDSYMSLRVFQLMGVPVPEKLHPYYRPLPVASTFTPSDYYSYDSARLALGMHIPTHVHLRIGKSLSLPMLYSARVAALAHIITRNERIRLINRLIDILDRQLGTNPTPANATQQLFLDQAIGMTLQTLKYHVKVHTRLRKELVAYLNKSSRVVSHHALLQSVYDLTWLSQWASLHLVSVRHVAKSTIAIDSRIGGGYSVTPTEPPTIASTFYGLMIHQYIQKS